MPRIGVNLSDETAMALRELALKKTGSMKGLSIIAEEAIKEYIEKHRDVD